MPRKTTIVRSVGNGPKREYTVTYIDDSPERAEAVAFFQKFKRGLFPAMNLPDSIDYLPFEDAQQYLDEHPIQEEWSILTITEVDSVSDDDLYRLQYLPELEVLTLMTSKLSDSGLVYLKWLVNLEWLTLYSRQLTNACLSHIVQLKSLQAVDMQCESQVTRDAYMQAIELLPNHRPERYPPWDAETTRRMKSLSSK